MLLKPTLALRLLAATKVPMMLFASPSVETLDDDECTVKIPLGFRTRNHVGSMYIAAMVAGAELAAGVPVLWLALRKHRGVIPIFRDLQCWFLKRADGDTLFRTRQVRQIVDAVAHAAQSGERVTVPVAIDATIPSRYGDEPVARFTIGLSVKRK